MVQMGGQEVEAPVDEEHDRHNQEGIHGSGPAHFSFGGGNGDQVGPTYMPPVRR